MPSASSINSIDDFFNNVKNVLQSEKFIDCTYPVFRGHSKSSYELLPTLHRTCLKTNDDIWELENNLYCDFRSLAGPRVNFKSSWDLVYTMRHEGVPTRLLDWSENIGTALFFALNSSDLDKPHVWILDPYKLNEEEHKITGSALVNPEEDLPEYRSTYPEYDRKTKKPKLHRFPIAIYPHRSNDRILAQRGIFTIHGTDERKMELSCSQHVEKINIPQNLIEPLKELIRHFGINSYSVYPDLKGLCEYLKDSYKY